MQKVTNRSMLIRSFVTRTKSHYEILGLERSSTHDDIKGAYYKLSMLHHPDKNSESDMAASIAAEKFREITRAYEVLGNVRLRKLYDKGILHKAGERYQNHEHTKEEEEDDPTTRFYKARMKNEHSRNTATGRTPIYDFDEWTSAHYGSEIRRQQRLNHTINKRKYEKATAHKSRQHELVLMALLIIFLGFGFMERNYYDVDKTKETKKPSDNK